MSITADQAVLLLEYGLFEAPAIAQQNAAYWVGQSETNSAYSTIEGVATAMAASPEGGIAEQVSRYYQGALGRLPSNVEISYYVAVAEQGLSAAQISQGIGGVSQATWNQIAGYFTAAPEFAQLHPAGTSVITGFYENILGRTPSADETAFYQKALDGGTSVPTLLQYFVNSPEYQAKANPGIQSSLAAFGEVVAHDPSLAGQTFVTQTQPVGSTGTTVIPVGLPNSVSFGDGAPHLG